jgi:ATP-binding cassette subfamily B protein
MVLADYFEHVLQLPLAYHAGAHSGRQMKVMLTGTDTLWWLWLSFFREHLSAFVFIVLLLPASLILNWRLALPLIVLCGAFTVLTVFVIRKSFALQRAVERHYSDLAETAADALGNVALVQSYARVELEVSALRSVVNSLLNAQMPVLSWWAIVTVLTRAGTTLTMLVILLVGTYLKLVGLASVGQIVSFMAIAAMLITRLEQAVSFSNRLFMDAPKLADFFDVLDTVPAVRDRAAAIGPGRVRGLVEFKGVSFSYDGKRSAVADLSFTALPGDRVALVGPTGSGKSTALALLYRAFDPQSGAISVDGIDIRDSTLSGLRHNIGVVFQETLLFNLRSRRTCASASRMPPTTSCARRRRARKPPTSSTAIPTVWKRASASALLKDPPILILDEATSALDPVTEARLNLALDEVMKGRTTFVIAHRLATIREATRILVFRDGRIVEIGTFDELTRRGGFFTELVRAQFGAPLSSSAKADDPVS